MKAILQIQLTLILLFVSQLLFCQIFVSTNATGNNDGSSWADAYNDLQLALSNYNEGDEIWVASGLYYPTSAVEVSSSDNSEKTFLIDKDLKMFGGFVGNEASVSERDVPNNPTILSGDLGQDDLEDDFEVNRSDNAINVVYVENTVTTESTLDGFTIEGGHAVGDTLILTNTRGGGLFSWGAIQINNCTFQQNYAEDFGGGLYYRDIATDGAKVSNCTFDGNSCLLFGGGVIFSSEGGRSEVDNCTFINNSGSFGAGLYGFETTITTTNCSFSNNSGTGGAAIYYSESITNTKNCTLSNNSSVSVAAFFINVDPENPLSYTYDSVIENCTFEKNVGQAGGAFFSNSSSFEMRSCVFIDNQAQNFVPSDFTLGGAIFFQYETTDDRRKAIIQNCEFINNSSDQIGGAIAIYDNSMEEGSNEIIIDDCLFEENTSPQGGGIGIFRLSNTAYISNSIFNNNSADLYHSIEAGNFFFTNNFELEIDNCLFRNHQNTDSNQSIIGYNNFLGKLNNCTFSDNNTSLVTLDFESKAKLINNIFNTTTSPSLVYIEGDEADAFTSLGGNLFSDNSAAALALDTDLQNVDPLFEPGSYELSENSPCVDAGILSNAVTDFDLDGDARIQGGCIDMGAYESIYDAGRSCVSNADELLEESAGLRLFPNPTMENITIVLDNNWNENLHIRILDMLGQVQAVHTGVSVAQSNPFSINTNNLVPGRYQIIVSNGLEFRTSSFVKI